MRKCRSFSAGRITTRPRRQNTILPRMSCPFLTTWRSTALIPIGGDDTLSYARAPPPGRVSRRRHPQDHGQRCLSAPTTASAFPLLSPAASNFIHNLRTSAGSHERIAIVELFGRNSGETSLISAYLAGVDRALISEVPFDVEKLASLLVDDKKDNPSNYAMVTISEGATHDRRADHRVRAGGRLRPQEAWRHRHGVSEAIKKLTGSHIIYQQLSYLMRSGAPDSLDLMVAFNYANMAMDLVAEGMSGRMVALQGGTYTHIPISTIMQGLKRVDVSELYDANEYRPKVRHVLGKPMFLY